MMRRLILWASLELALRKRRAARPLIRDRARKGAATKIHKAFENDRLLNGARG
jgi:hypothetical protein